MKRRAWGSGSRAGPTLARWSVTSRIDLGRRGHGLRGRRRHRVQHRRRRPGCRARRHPAGKPSRRRLAMDSSLADASDSAARMPAMRALPSPCFRPTPSILAAWDVASPGRVNSPSPTRDRPSWRSTRRPRVRRSWYRHPTFLLLRMLPGSSRSPPPFTGRLRQGRPSRAPSISSRTTPRKRASPFRSRSGRPERP